MRFNDHAPMPSCRRSLAICHDRLQSCSCCSQPHALSRAAPRYLCRGVARIFSAGGCPKHGSFLLQLHQNHSNCDEMSFASIIIGLILVKNITGYSGGSTGPYWGVHNLKPFCHAIFGPIPWGHRFLILILLTLTLTVTLTCKSRLAPVTVSISVTH